ncbi:MAG: DnaJ domain-containing protein [Desulfomonilaceae bacterium]
MESSTLEEKVFRAIHERPGSSMEWFGEQFGLSLYRLRRVFRRIQRDLEDAVVVQDPDRGVWIVELDASLCSGVNWVGEDQGGFRQCSDSVLFPDGRCYEHSRYECAEMAALSRRLHFLTGPKDPSVQTLAESAVETLQELLHTLEGIQPATRRDWRNKVRFQRLLMSAVAFKDWKRRMAALSEDDEIPYELRRRHRNSSGSPYEFALRKYFVLLRVPVDAAKEEVLKAWKKLALLYHPDVQGEDGDEEMMKAVNEAKEKIFHLRGWD